MYSIVVTSLLYYAFSAITAFSSMYLCIAKNITSDNNNSESNYDEYDNHDDNDIRLYCSNFPFLCGYTYTKE